MNIIESLDKAIRVEDQILVGKNRVDGVLTEAVKILTALSTTDLGETSNEVVAKLREIAVKLQVILA